MERKIGLITLVVKDYDEAIAFYTQKLAFELVEDTPLDERKRWVVIKPANATGEGCSVLLAKAANDEQQAAIGNQTGGRVFLFLYTDNFERDYEMLLRNNVVIIRPPTDEPYGRVLVFSDLYGNMWDMIQQKK